MKIKCTPAALNSLKYSVPVSVLIFCGWIPSLVSLGYLFGIYNSSYNVSSTTLDHSPHDNLNVCVAYIHVAEDIMSTYLVPQWLLVFFLPITITVYIMALATDHWVAEVFSYGVTCFSITCCGGVVFLLGQNLVLIERGGCKNQPQFTGSIIGFVGNGLVVIFLTLALTLVSLKKRCDSRMDVKEARKTEVMADLKKNLPIEMNVNDVYGLSHSVANVSLRGEGDGGFGLRGGRSQVSVYEDVN